MNTAAFWWIVALVAGAAVIAGMFRAELRELLFLNSGGTLPQTLEWRTLSEPEDTDGTPQTRVVLLADGREYDAGVYPGSCHSDDPASEHPLPYEKSYIVCWWAGGGYELGVFQEGNAYVLKRGELDEGTAEMAGFRGNFQKLFVIE